jgi:hypothetical protein
VTRLSLVRTWFQERGFDLFPTWAGWQESAAEGGAFAATQLLSEVRPATAKLIGNAKALRGGAACSFQKRRLKLKEGPGLA